MHLSFQGAPQAGKISLSYLPYVRDIEMVLLSLGSSAPCFSRQRLCCRSRVGRSATVIAQSPADNNKSSRRKANTVPSAGSVLGGLTFQPLQKSKKGTTQPWSSGIVCTDKECNYKADEGTVAWLRELFIGLDVDRYNRLPSVSEATIVQKALRLFCRLQCCKDSTKMCRCFTGMAL